MGAPRYQPRIYCDRPKAFGKSSDLLFGPLSPTCSDVPATVAERRSRLDTAAYARAALVQHEHAFAIRHILNVRKMTQIAYAQLIGEDIRRVGGMLRGEVIMRADDIERAELALGGVYALIRFDRRRKALRQLRAALDELDSKHHESALS